MTLTPSLSGAATAFDLDGSHGFPLEFTLDVPLKDASGNAIPWSEVSNIACAVYSRGGSLQSSLAPTVASPSANIITLSWSATQTTDAPSELRYVVSFEISGYLYPLIAGSLSFGDPTDGQPTTSASATLNVTVGGGTATITVALGGIGPGVLSLSAADSSITVGGTASEPTVAVDTSVIATVADVTDETTRAENAEATKLTAADNLSDLPNAATARTNLGLGSAATQSSSAFDAAGAASNAQAAAESYTDSSVTNETNRAEAAEAKLLPLAGGTMTGLLAMAGQSIKVRVVTAAGAVAQPTDQFIRGDGNGAATSYTLAAATGSGRVIVCENNDPSAGVFTINPSGTDTIRGLNRSVLLVQLHDRVTLCDVAAGNWDVLEVSFAPVYLTTSQSWTCPLSGTWKVECQGGGGGGGGAGSALTTGGVASQSGGGGGGAGAWASDTQTLNAGTVYGVTVGAGSAGGAGGAANGGGGNNGGGQGGQSTFSGTGPQAAGGGTGIGSSGNFNGQTNSGSYGGISPLAAPRTPGGGGGANTTLGYDTNPAGNGIAGGGGGAASNATQGGVGGNVQPLLGNGAGYAVAHESTADGGNGADGTVPGSGGAGGGGGAPGGAGGNGGKGADGYVRLTFIA